MTEAAKMRMKRIERLLSELEYEIVRGVMEREIEPDLHVLKTFPCRGRGDDMAQLEIHLYPVNGGPGLNRPAKVKLRLVDPEAGQ